MGLPIPKLFPIPKQKSLHDQVDAFMEYLIKEEMMYRKSGLKMKLPFNISKYWLRHTISRPWPRGWVVIPETDGCETESADPNDHWRHYLTTNVGRQGWSWEWDIDHNNHNNIVVHFRKQEDAVMFSLRYC